ncbi:hypothetical protein DFJ73DRAFT_805980 [Zopfochytrium polystomum]|nr:hypothetical protein DFJ73DRAFT_805980 [Zopfochytrium polystomum]
MSRARQVALSSIPTVAQWYRSYAYARVARQLAHRPPVPVAGQAPITPSAELNSKVSIWRGDITTLAIDAIVNAANSSLLGGGGVDGAIHRAAGPGLYDECARLGGCDTGDAKATAGHRLPARTVVHAVGPRGGTRGRDVLLRRCYTRSLAVGVEDGGARSIAFPCISTGVYGYPQEEAAHIALGTVRRWLEEHGGDVDRIVFCIFLESDLEIYERLVNLYFPDEAVVEDDDGEKAAAAAEVKDAAEKKKDDEEDDGDAAGKQQKDEKAAETPAAAPGSPVGA